MLFAVTCLDKPDHTAVRLAHRPAHLEWLKANTGAVKIAGPFTSEDGASMIGSLLVVEADDREGAKALLAGDPYAAADLFGSVEIRPWKWVIGNPG